MPSEGMKKPTLAVAILGRHENMSHNDKSHYEEEADDPFEWAADEAYDCLQREDKEGFRKALRSAVDLAKKKDNPGHGY